MQEQIKRREGERMWGRKVERHAVTDERLMGRQRESCLGGCVCSRLSLSLERLLPLSCCVYLASLITVITRQERSLTSLPRTHTLTHTRRQNTGTESQRQQQQQQEQPLGSRGARSFPFQICSLASIACTLAYESHLILLSFPRFKFRFPLSLFLIPLSFPADGRLSLSPSLARAPL